VRLDDAVDLAVAVLLLHATEGGIEASGDEHFCGVCDHGGGRAVCLAYTCVRPSPVFRDVVQLEQDLCALNPVSLSFALLYEILQRFAFLVVQRHDILDVHVPTIRHFSSF
jgi:hypothetical protein